ncbi:MAG: hypothetical protein HZA51_16245 [Planctomycetes bacterium]|nr:hypothetical protein [Planctomycetota bacterium]
MRKTAIGIVVVLQLIALSGANCQPFLAPDLSLPTPLLAGVYSGDASCVRTTTTEQQDTQETPPPTGVIFEFSSAGLPIIRGEELRSGRREPLGSGVVLVYTRIASITNGIVIHSNFENTGGSVIGSSIATLQAEGATTIRYKLNSSITDGGLLVVNNCNAVLTKQ